MTDTQSTQNKTTSDPMWCPWQAGDAYSGAGKVVAAELEYIKQRRKDANETNLTGLALSGGGIRSAIFSLGVMQALARKGWLQKFDYLSTVSGGGYIGSSLTWLLHKKWNYRDNNNLEHEFRFGLDADTFPYKTEPVWSQQSPPKPVDKSGQRHTIPDQILGSMLRWLRQHGKYLTPGGDHTVLTLIAVVLRSSVLNILFYLAALVLVFIGLNAAGAFEPVSIAIGSKDRNIPLLLGVAGCLAMFFVVTSLLYAVLTCCLKTIHAGNSQADADVDHRYIWRRRIEKYLRYLFILMLLFLVMGVIPLVPDAIAYLMGKEHRDTISNTLGVVTAIAGLLSSVGVFSASTARETPKQLNLMVTIAATLLLFGFLLLGYQLATHILPDKSGDISGFAYILLLALVASAFFNNLNYISVHRYYRDRLMETFMPDVGNAIKNSGNDAGSSPQADRTFIQNVCGGMAGACGPYHLINTNIVLVSSKRPKFKSRGGDNFILSPKYCGSNATGWRHASEFMNGGMPLATAMAISGAAVNPKTGCGGAGITRNPLLSTLMGLLNIRLGYWAPNPDPERKPYITHPSLMWPGLGELALNKYLNEDSQFIQLSDGGHFENLAIYELIRRKLKLIVVCDGGADPKYTFSDLANAIEKARADFGALIKVNSEDLSDLVSRKCGADAVDDGTETFAKRGHLVATIHYADGSQGTLIYLTTTFTHNLSADLYGYRKEHNEFPDEPTSDQFFEEKQFEAYRELGFQLAWAMLSDTRIYSVLSPTASDAVTT